jgi:hypothetical protein
MAVTDLTTCQKMVMALTNSGPDDFSWSVNVGDERFGATGAASDQAKEAIFESDEAVVLAILETEGHWARPDFTADSSALAYLDEIPTHIGSTGDVKIVVSNGGVTVPGRPATVEEIFEWRTNLNNAFGSLAHNAVGNAIAGYYSIKDNIAHFTGYTLTLKLATFTRTAACQSPNIYQNAVVVGALATLFPKEGSWLSKAQFYYAQQQRMLGEIRSNLAVAPVLEQYESVKG